MNAQYDNVWHINIALAQAFAYLTMVIVSLSTDLKYAHCIITLIKTSTQEETAIYISIVSNLHSFIMFDIEDLFDKIKTIIQEYPFYLFSKTTDENTHSSFGAYSSYVYHHPPPRDLTDEFPENIKEFYKTYPTGDLIYYPPETILCLHQNLKINTWNYQHYVPNPESYLLYRADYKIIFMTNILQNHIQRQRVEERADAAGTATASIPNAISTPIISTLATETTLSDPYEETFN